MPVDSPEIRVSGLKCVTVYSVLAELSTGFPAPTGVQISEQFSRKAEPCQTRRRLSVFPAGLVCLDIDPKLVEITAD